MRLRLWHGQRFSSTVPWGGCHLLSIWAHFASIWSIFLTTNRPVPCDSARGPTMAVKVSFTLFFPLNSLITLNPVAEQVKKTQLGNIAGMQKRLTTQKNPIIQLVLFLALISPRWSIFIAFWIEVEYQFLLGQSGNFILRFVGLEAISHFVLFENLSASSRCSHTSLLYLV